MNVKRSTLAFPFVALTMLAGCKGDEGDSDPAPGAAGGGGPGPTSAYVMLSPIEHLVRVSTALRGVRPSEEEIERVKNDPAAIEGVVDAYLATPEFGATLRDMHNEALLVRAAPIVFPLGFPARGPLAAAEQQALNLSLVEAPLRLVEHVVMNDRPYSEIVTADYTLADGNVAAVWGLGYDGDGPSWRVTRWDDGRPNAGILSDSMLFTRHSTTYSNGNRGRANLVSTALLCYDFLSREITGADASINLGDPKEVADAVKVNQGCAGCHQTLDPLASYFGAFHPLFVPADPSTTYPFTFYLPALEPVFRVTEPAYFGQRGEGLAFLGQAIASDPRFSLCATKRFYGYLHEVTPADVPLEEVAPLHDAFVRGGMNARQLVKTIVLGDAFRAASGPEGGAGGRLLKVRPTQLARLVEDLTGFRWKARLDFELPTGQGAPVGKVGEVDLMTDSFFGLEVLAGGIDGVNVTLPAHTMTPSSSLTLRSLASLAAQHVVASDFAQPDPARRKLLRKVGPGEAGEAPLRDQIAALYLRLYGVAADPNGDEVSATYALFTSARQAAGGDGARAWTTTLFAMLQDARIAYYLPRGCHVNALKRRTLFKGAAAVAAAGLLPFDLPKARGDGPPRGGPARNLVIVLNSGGWDTTYVFDPKPGVAGIDAPASEIGAYGGLRAGIPAGAPNVDAFFAAYGAQAAVINGVQISSFIHPDCVKRVLTGSPTTAKPDVGALVAAELGRDLPVPYLVLGNSAISGPLAPLTGRAGTTNQLAGLLRPGAAQLSYGAMPPPALVPSAAEDDLVKGYLAASAERFRAARGAGAFNGARVDDYLSASERGDLLRSFAGQGAGFGDVGYTPDLNVQVDLAVTALAKGLSRAIMMETFNWDTHTGNERQAVLHNDLFGALSNLAGKLSAANLLASTTVLVLSEMGRTPKLNGSAGKDHWPVTSALAFGAGVAGGRVYGASDDRLGATSIDLATGAPSATGKQLQAANLLAGVLSIVGVDPATAFPAVEPFHALAASLSQRRGPHARPGPHARAGPHPRPGPRPRPRPALRARRPGRPRRPRMRRGRRRQRRPGRLGRRGRRGRRGRGRRAQQGPLDRRLSDRQRAHLRELRRPLLALVVQRLPRRVAARGLAAKRAGRHRLRRPRQGARAERTHRGAGVEQRSDDAPVGRPPRGRAAEARRVARLRRSERGAVHRPARRGGGLLGRGRLGRPAGGLRLARQGLAPGRAAALQGRDEGLHRRLRRPGRQRRLREGVLCGRAGPHRRRAHLR
jgi:uncharacterized protein DUF1501